MQIQYKMNSWMQVFSPSSSGFLALGCLCKCRHSAKVCKGMQAITSTSISILCLPDWFLHLEGCEKGRGREQREGRVCMQGRC